MHNFTLDIVTVNDVTIIIRLVLSVISGGIIGLERGKMGRPAGLRTHILVCLGSALAILTNQYISQELYAGDPARLGAQVISGIGFLGVGTIITTGTSQVKGLTTAAGLWATACMGLAIGIGFYKGAIVSLILIWFVTGFLQRLDNHLFSRSKLIDVFVEFEDIPDVNSLVEIIESKVRQIDSIEILKDSRNVNGNTSAILKLLLQDNSSNEDIILDIGSIEGINWIEEIRI